VHGTEATGKSVVVKAVLDRLGARSGSSNHHAPLSAYAVVDVTECITTRHFLETTVGRVADAVAWQDVSPRCDSISQLTVHLSKVLLYTTRPPEFHFILVLDAIDRLREASPSLLPALARLPELVR
jgi:origin recognition complex subunit 5